MSLILLTFLLTNFLALFLIMNSKLLLKALPFIQRGSLPPPFQPLEDGILIYFHQASPVLRYLFLLFLQAFLAAFLSGLYIIIG